MSSELQIDSKDLGTVTSQVQSAINGLDTSTTCDVTGSGGVGVDEAIAQAERWRKGATACALGNATSWAERLTEVGESFADVDDAQAKVVAAGPRSHHGHQAV
ncbi:hypothetical protein [Demequina sediminicola]|uniref:hypothetical protein n=1 Tax=Demequina sediminicola TaxID=1095026 RepID=UPI000780924F|nr:hypothetical protein [Demequina sediminicola]